MPQLRTRKAKIRRRRRARTLRAKGTYKRWAGDTPQKKGDPGIRPPIPPYSPPPSRMEYGVYQDPISPGGRRMQSYDDVLYGRGRGVGLYGRG